MGNISICVQSQQGPLFPQNPLGTPWIHPLPHQECDKLCFLSRRKPKPSTPFFGYVQQREMSNNETFLGVITVPHRSASILNLSFCVHPEWDILFCQTSCLIFNHNTSKLILKKYSTLVKTGFHK